MERRINLQKQRRKATPTKDGAQSTLPFHTLGVFATPEKFYSQFWKLNPSRDGFFFVFFYQSRLNQSSALTQRSLHRLSACGNDTIQMLSKTIKIDFFIWLHNNGCCHCVSTWGIMRKSSIWVSIHRIGPLCLPPPLGLNSKCLQWELVSLRGSRENHASCDDNPGSWPCDSHY